MRWTGHMQVGEKRKKIAVFLVRNPLKRAQLQDLDVNGRTIMNLRFP
jgi:hypothetical protein